MNKKGFSLMELMLVLALIGILAIITVPMILNVVAQANEKAFLDTASTINKSAANYYAASSMDDEKVLPLYVTYENSKIKSNETTDGVSLETKNYLDYKGKHPDSGNILIKENGEVTMAIFDNRSGKCVEKEVNDKTPKVTDKSKEGCYLTFEN